MLVKAAMDIFKMATCHSDFTVRYKFLEFRLQGHNDQITFLDFMVYQVPVAFIFQDETIV